MSVPIGMAVAGAATQSTTTQVRFKLTADTFVASDAPNARHGSDTDLKAGWNGGTRRSYVQVAVSGLPSGASSVKAQLTFTRTAHHLPSPISLSTVSTNKWAERTLTWKSAPAVGSKVATVYPTVDDSVLSFAVPTITGNGTYSFAITGPSSDVADVYSRESATPPVLSVSYVTTTVVPDPTPTATATATAPAAPTTPTTSPIPTATATASPSPTATSTTTPAPAPSTTSCTVSAILVPSCGAWFGAAPAPLWPTPPTNPLAAFESEIGRQVDIVHYYHVNTQLFPTASEISQTTGAAGKRLLLINWKPATDYTWAQVAAGAVDSRIDNEAAYIKSHFTSRLFLAIYHEPEDNVVATTGSGMTAQDYHNMYRHVALRLRADGVSNAVFVMDYMGYWKWGVQSWWSTLYPGSDIVDWIAFDPYTTASTDSQDFSQLMNQWPQSGWPGFYNWATSFAPGKPIMLGEWGVNETQLTDKTRKPWFFGTVSQELGKYPALKALVYFNAPDFQIDSTAASLAAYRTLGSDPRFQVPVP